jgi:hypothetical protein
MTMDYASGDDPLRQGYRAALRTRSPFLTTIGAVPGKTLAFKVSRLKSVISIGFARKNGATLFNDR